MTDSDPSDQLDWTCEDCGLGLTGWSTDPETTLMCPGCNQTLQADDDTDE